MGPITRFFLPLLLLTALVACASRELSPPPVKGAKLMHIRVGHDLRSYWLYEPASVAKPSPLVIVLHASGSNGAAMIKLGNFASKARTAGFVLAAPNARDGAFDAGAGDAWPRNEKVDDVAFISRMIDAIRGRYPISHVYAVGFSSGGAMAQRLAVAIPDKLDGIASVAGQLQPPLFEQPLGKVHPLPMLLMFGNEDPLQPVKGGPVRYGKGQVVETPAPKQTARHWAGFYGCSTSIAATAKIIRQTGWYGCSNNVTVILLSIEGLGHHWPGGDMAEEAGIPGQHLGPYLGNVKATDIIWNFFAHIAKEH